MIAIVVGHSEASPGARLLDSAVYEWHWNRVLAEKLAGDLALAGVQSKIFRRPEVGTYQEQMRAVCSAINEFRGTKLVVALHFNAMPADYRGTKAGCVALYYPGSAAGARAAAALSAAASVATGNRDRGIRARGVSWSGAPLYVLQLTRAPAVILEPFFGGHPGDAAAATQARDGGQLSEALARAIEGVIA